MDDLIDRNTLDDTFIRLNDKGWELTRYEHKRMESVLFEMPTVKAVPLSVVDDIKTILIRDANSAVNDNLRDILVAFANHVIDNIDRKVKEYEK